MQFTNAKKGISKVFWGAIFELISAVAAGIALSLLTDALIGDTGAAGSVIGVILSTGAFVLAILGFIFNLVGLYTAGKDSKYLKDAFTLSIVGLIVALIGGIFSATGVDALVIISRALVLFVDILEIGIVIYTCLGTSNLLFERNEDKVAASGSKTAYIFAITFALGAIISMVAILFQASMTTVNVGSVLTVILAIAYIVLDIVAYIMYLVFLGKAKNRLAD